MNAGKLSNHVNSCVLFYSFFIGWSYIDPSSYYITFSLQVGGEVRRYLSKKLSTRSTKIIVELELPCGIKISDLGSH